MAMSGTCRRLVSGGLATVFVPLLLLFAPSGSVSADQAPSAGGVSWQATSPDSTGVVPNVTWWEANSAIAAVQAAGFVAQTAPGWVDCSASPFVQYQSPAGGASASLGSSVFLYLNQQPAPGQDCP
jgi:beta-lactam-binding protein with PASTA domain